MTGRGRKRVNPNGISDLLCNYRLAKPSVAEDGADRTNLLHLENGVKEADIRIVQLDASKLSMEIANTLVKSVNVVQRQVLSLLQN